MSTKNFFLDDGFFLDINNLYIGYMANDATVSLNANLNANLNPPTALYAIFIYLFRFLLQFFYASGRNRLNLYILFRYDLFIYSISLHNYINQCNYNHVLSSVIFY
jgi:hypothetical protein